MDIVGLRAISLIVHSWVNQSQNLPVLKFVGVVYHRLQMWSLCVNHHSVQVV